MRMVQRKQQRKIWLTTPKQWIALMCFLVLGVLSGQAQSSNCGCSDDVIVKLDENCNFELTVENVQAGTCPDGSMVIVDDGNNLNGGIIDCAGEFPYGIYQGEHLICWGTVIAEDKSGPIVMGTISPNDTIECHLIDNILNNPETINPEEKYYMGEILFRDNCSACDCYINKTFSDFLEYADCEETLDNNVYARLVRKWTAIDCEGYTTTADQVFVVVRPDLDDLIKVADTTIQTCNAADTVLLTQYPFWIDVFGDSVYLDQVTCNYGVNVENEAFPNCNDGSYKQINTVKVFDWCAGGSFYVDTFIVKVGDFEGPRVTRNAFQVDSTTVFEDLVRDVDRDSLKAIFEAGKMRTISIGPSECSASLSLQLQTLRITLGFGIEDCNNLYSNIQIFSYAPQTKVGVENGDTAWVKTNYPMYNGVAAGIPVGIHAMRLELIDDCGNVSTALVFFMVKDQIAPVMKCDDQLRITLTENAPLTFDRQAYSRLDAVDVDEGSFDNCELGFLKIRRSVDDLGACQAFFIDLGYDANNDGEIDEEDWFDENENGVFDSDTEFKWEYKDSTWFTPWRDYAEFFCCDVDQSIVIELGGWDEARNPLTFEKERNLNYCWQTTIIEDATIPSLLPLPVEYIKCTESIMDQLRDGPLEGAHLDSIRARFGETLPYGIFCGGVELKEKLVDNRDHCGFGRIDRVIEAIKVTALKDSAVGTLVQTIYVKEVFDYNVCFPADQTYTCEENLDSIPGISYESNGCDLFALSHVDEQFDAVGDIDACFKIFRTYRVINWCEYDGASAPVIVGRDWDSWNGCDEGDDPEADPLPEYNINPLNPDGDGHPGDEGICIIVDIDYQDNNRDIVYYDRNANPFDNIPDDTVNTEIIEGYWWKVVSGNSDPTHPLYGSNGYKCSTEGVWNNDNNNTNGPDFADDDDYRYGSHGFWQYTQHIKVSDGEAPTVSMEVADTIKTTKATICEADVTMRIIADDNCSANLTTSVELDLFNDQTNIMEVSEYLSGDVLTMTLPFGQHRFIVTVEDVCNNSVSEEKIITVVDGVAPSPICLSTIIAELMPDPTARQGQGGGSIAIWATDFIASPVGDCTGQNAALAPVGSGFQKPMVTAYSINRLGQEVVRDSTGVVVDCDDVDILVPVEVHAWDDAGNHNFCRTFIQVQDNLGVCSEANGTIAGTIATEEFNRVEGVEVQLSGGTAKSLATDTYGNFDFSQLPEGQDYTIIPKLDQDHDNGVSTLDLILIQKHILGSKRLDTPYKIIAADINRSGGVSTLDLIQLRKVILQIEPTFASNTSWRFVDAEYTFDDPAHPFSKPFPELKNINDLDGRPDVDFVAIKVGDVNYTSKANSIVAPEVRTQVGMVGIHTANIKLVKGHTYTVGFNADLSGLLGYQFTLDYDQHQLEILDLQASLMNEEHFGRFEAEGKLSASFNVETALEGDQSLFNIVVRAKSDANLKDLIRINSSVTQAEAYNIDAEPMGLYLAIGEEALDTEASLLFQNYPNPFISETAIGFYLPEANAITIQIHGVEGRIIKTIEGDYSAGYHSIPLNNSDLPSTGVYSYRLLTGDFEGSRQLILLD